MTGGTTSIYETTHHLCCVLHLKFYEWIRCVQMRGDNWPEALHVGGGSVLPALLQLLNRFPPPPSPPPPGFCCHGKKVFFGCEGGWGCGEGSQRKFSLHGNKNREGNIFFQQDNFFLSIEVISTQRNISSWIDKHFLPSKKTFPFTNFFLGQCASPLVLFSSRLFAAKSRYCESSVKVKFLRDWPQFLDQEQA